MAHATVRGCRDVLGRGAAARRALVGRFAHLCGVYGFGEVETPVLERAGTFAGALGATSDVVSSELFHVAGAASGAGVVLRPEGTAGVARALRAAGVARRGAAAPGMRVWYAGPMFRHERPQRLRLRQFTQLGAEAVGDPSVSADVDVVALAARFLRATHGGARAKLRVNTLGGKDDRERFNAALREWLRPRYSALSPLSRMRFDAGNCMRVLDSKLAEDMDAMRGAPGLWEFLSAAEIERFEVVMGRLEEEGIEFEVEKSLVRGLDYYSSTAFEFIGDGGRAVCAGGRYSDLHGLHGVGFAIGLERVEDPSIMNSEADDMGLRNAVVVLPIDRDAERKESEVGAVARDVTRRLRAAGICAVARLNGGKLGKQMSRAIKAGASVIIFVGPEDVRRGTVKVKVIDHSDLSCEPPEQDVDMDSVVEMVSTLRMGEEKTSDTLCASGA